MQVIMTSKGQLLMYLEQLRLIAFCPSKPDLKDTSNFKPTHVLLESKSNLCFVLYCLLVLNPIEITCSL